MSGVFQVFLQHLVLILYKKLMRNRQSFLHDIPLIQYLFLSAEFIFAIYSDYVCFNCHSVLIAYLFYDYFCRYPCRHVEKTSCTAHASAYFFQLHCRQRLHVEI